MSRARVFGASIAILIAVGAAGTASADARCDTAKRRETYYDDAGHQHSRYTDHNSPGDADQVLGTPENVVVKDGSGRYGAVTNDAWVEALGGSGYGSGQQDDPQHRAAEGGAVQGDVHPTEASGAPDVNFGVNAFSPLDETDNGHFFDSAAGACVSVNGTTASSGEQYVPTSSVPHP